MSRRRVTLTIKPVKTDGVVSPLGGKTIPKTGRHTYRKGEVATVTAIASKGFAFAGWTVKGSPEKIMDNPLKVTM